MTLDHKDNLDLWVEALHQKGFGNSEVQKTFITVLSLTQCPMSAEEIREAVQRIRPETGRATVYRFIDKLTGLGLLRRVHGYRNCSTYFPSLEWASNITDLHRMRKSVVSQARFVHSNNQKHRKHHNRTGGSPYNSLSPATFWNLQDL